MVRLRLGPSSSEFIWASGVEDTFVPQTKAGHRALDEYQLMGHYQHWREDLKLARDLGVQAVRWGIPWYRVEPLPTEFDWSWTDDVLSYIVNDLQITPIVDLMHYGCPFWLRREFASDQYPDAVTDYVAAFARRYAGLVHWYTPLNEPLVNALMCGKRGLWPPYLRGETGYIRLVMQLIKGILGSSAAIKEIDPDAILVHVEAAGLSRAAREDLEVLAVEDQRRGYLCYDLLTGKVTPDHPLFPWLVRHGAPPDDLAAIAAQKIQLDVLGMNFYPQWSLQQLYVTGKGKVAYRAVEEEGGEFIRLIEDYYSRYRAPVIVTETSAYGPDKARQQWLERSTRAIKDLRSRGIPVLGYTWFPMFTMIDWRYRFGRAPIEKYRMELGLFRLSDEPGPERWAATPLVDQLRDCIQNAAAHIGELLPTEAVAPETEGGDMAAVVSERPSRPEPSSP
jgi:beta-glucosidase/6-phospho-beta-glucosidase/beta-galactosidase